MSNNINFAPVSVSEQTTVLRYIQDWLGSLDFLEGITISVSSLDLEINNLSIVPTQGVKKARQYACGGYQVYFPFQIYFRTSAEGFDEISNSYNLVDKIGDAAYNADLNTLLGSDMTADSFSQETTTVLLARQGIVSDYRANFVLIYSV